MSRSDQRVALESGMLALSVTIAASYGLSALWYRVGNV